MKKRIIKGLAITLSTILMVGTSSAISSSVVKGDTVPVKDANGEVTLYIVRHGKTMLNTTDRVQGWSDAVLTPAGEEIVEYVAYGLQDIEFGAAYSSDSGRAVQTANIILAENNTPNINLQTDKRLREFNFGTYEGEYNHIMWQEMAGYHGMTLNELFTSGKFTTKLFADTVAELDKVKALEEGADGINWPAEAYDEITTRLLESIDEIVETESKKGDENVLVVSHGLSITALLNEIVPEADLPQGLTNASVTIVKYKEGEFTLESVNDMSYAEIGKEIAVTKAAIK